MSLESQPLSSSFIDQAVSALFVPGDRPERFEKAARSGAGTIILDLEDAVAENKRNYALDCVINAISSGLKAAVRIVSSEHSAHKHQLDRLSKTSVAAIMIPKTQSVNDVSNVRITLGQVPIIALIETAQGVVNASEIAAAPGVTRLAFGAFDFSLDVDGDSPWLLGYARAAVVVASRAAGIAAPLDSPTGEFRDLNVVKIAAHASRASGFGGQLCIHPAQIAAVNEAFYPTPEQIAQAKSVLTITDGVAAIDGQMIDRPIIERAKRLLAIVESRESS